MTVRFLGASHHLTLIRVTEVAIDADRRYDVGRPDFVRDRDVLRADDEEDAGQPHGLDRLPEQPDRPPRRPRPLGLQRPGVGDRQHRPQR